jgi:hypothetical protein
VFGIEPLSSSLRLGNMVGGLGWLRKEKSVHLVVYLISRGNGHLSGRAFSLSRILHRVPRATDATRRDKAWDRAQSIRSLVSTYASIARCSYFAILLSESGRTRSAGFSWINLIIMMALEFYNDTHIRWNGATTYNHKLKGRMENR